MNSVDSHVLKRKRRAMLKYSIHVYGYCFATIIGRWQLTELWLLFFPHEIPSLPLKRRVFKPTFCKQLPDELISTLCIDVHNNR